MITDDCITPSEQQGGIWTAPFSLCLFQKLPELLLLLTVTPSTCKTVLGRLQVYASMLGHNIDGAMLVALRSGLLVVWVLPFLLPVRGQDVIRCV